jgi:hypothetical protein
VKAQVEAMNTVFWRVRLPNVPAIIRTNIPADLDERDIDVTFMRRTLPDRTEPNTT